MKKLTLDLDALAVESFDAETPDAGQGTVQGRQQSVYDTCYGQQTCGGNTCADSCDGVCGSYYCVTGDGSCDENHSCVWTCDGTHYMTCDDATCRACSNIWC